MSWLGKIAKLLFIFYFILFAFKLITQERSIEKYHMSYHIMGLHNKYRKVVHKPYNNVMVLTIILVESYLRLVSTVEVHVC